MTLLVKNEEDILEQNLIFHKQKGVDFFHRNRQQFHRQDS